MTYHTPFALHYEGGRRCFISFYRSGWRGCGSCGGGSCESRLTTLCSPQQSGQGAEDDGAADPDTGEYSVDDGGKLRVVRVLLLHMMRLRVLLLHTMRLQPLSKRVRPGQALVVTNGAAAVATRK